MEFVYTITFSVGHHSIVRSGKGFHYPHEGGFNLEDMLWQMTEEFGRPQSIEIKMTFGGSDG